MSKDFLTRRLKAREDDGSLRKLSTETAFVDFASNDYLGFARSEELKNIGANESIISRQKRGSSAKPGHYPLSINHGSTGSRLLTGNTAYMEDLEKFIAAYHHAEAGLIFNSGYDANIGLLSSVAQKGDMILYDELCHASIHDGVRLSKGDSFPFKHNDIVHLEERLKFFRSTGGDGPDHRQEIFIVVESVYSMDGDFAALIEIADLCELYKANFIVDEAHATGIFGKKGEGKVSELGLEKNVFARVHTFGKALGCHGAVVLGNNDLRDFLINFSRSFIYTTALPLHALVTIKKAYQLLDISTDKMLNINSLIHLFISKVETMKISGFLKSSSPIQSLLVKGNAEVKKVAFNIQKDGYDVRPILSPTVPKGKERIRICLHTFNTEEEIIGLLASIQKHSVLKIEHDKFD